MPRDIQITHDIDYGQRDGRKTEIETVDIHIPDAHLPERRALVRAIDDLIEGFTARERKEATANWCDGHPCDSCGAYTDYQCDSLRCYDCCRKLRGCRRGVCRPKPTRTVWTGIPNSCPCGGCDG